MGIMDKRAERFCQMLKDSGIVHEIDVEWKNSRMYGLCPSIRWRGEKIGHAGGCGYDKLSQVLADVLCHLGTDRIEAMSIARTAGAGEDSVVRALAKIGWRLERVATGKAFDGFAITKA